MQNSDTLKLASELIAINSITPADNGCQKIIANILQKAGFNIYEFNSYPVNNLWAIYGDSGPIFAFAGHTDVVDVGNEDTWQYPPFKPTIDNNFLYGRGAQDMKGALASMVIAAKTIAERKLPLKGRLALLITSGEEGSEYLKGTPYVLEKLQEKNEKITWCIVGEPSCSKELGDTIRNGRRGSLKAFLDIIGVQGHVAYPELANNPMHSAAEFINEFIKINWCFGNEYFSPTIMQIATAKTNTQAINVIPGELNLGIAFRYSSAITHDEIKNKMHKLLQKHKLNFNLNWEHSGRPFLTQTGKLLASSKKIIAQALNITPILSTGGGTSDGRFISPTGAEVIEFGTTNSKIHQINEAVAINELETLTKIYESIALDILT